MSLQYTTDTGVTLKVPGAYADTQVVSTPSTVAANGIILAIGESDSGPSFLEEDDLSQNAFGPDQKSDILAKYGSGQLVDAFIGAVTASNDPNVKGSFTRFIPLKTNSSTKATATLPAIGGGIYANLTAKAGGKPGNLITRTVTVNQAEAIPSTGAFILASPPASTTVNFRVNGGAAVTASLTTEETPTAMVAAIAALDGVIATGGVSRGTIGNVITPAAAITVDAGYNLHIVSAFIAYPHVGDIVVIPSTAAVDIRNQGTFLVTAVNQAATRIDLCKVWNVTSDALTAPLTQASTTLDDGDIFAYSPVTISLESGAVVPGKGKTLEIAETATGVFSNLCYVASADGQTVSKASFVSTTALPALMISGQEYKVEANFVRQKDGISENIVAGGNCLLSIGYVGTTASAVINNGVMTITLTGGSSSSLSPISISLSDYPTIGDLCQYLGSLAGFVAYPSLATYSSISPLVLDAGTYSFATDKGVATGRIKGDGHDLMTEINSQSVLVDVAPLGVATNLVGLPDQASVAFLSGGSRGSTTTAIIQSALDAAKAVKANFVVPLFSNNSSVDIADGSTDAASSYDIASINSATRAHCLQMSQLKQRRRRLAILSNRDTFANDKIAAGGIASARCALTIQDVRDNNAFGTLTTFKPWMTAIKAAAMQAAGFYKDITHKYITINAATVPGGGYNYNLVSNVEDALDAGLLVVTYDGSGFKWVSDQTTYSVDDNFVYNSLQAMYAADLVAATAEQRMERAFVGQSLADVSATVGVTVLGTILDDIRRLKLIAPSDDAPRGFKNVVIKIVNGNTMVVGVEIKLATSIKFIPITFMITAIQQTATG